MPAFVKELYSGTLQDLEAASGLGAFFKGALFAWGFAFAGVILLGIVLSPLFMVEHWLATLAVLVVGLPAVALIRYYAGSRPAYRLAERKGLGAPVVWGVGGFFLPWLVVGLASCLAPRS